MDGTIKRCSGKFLTVFAAYGGSFHLASGSFTNSSTPCISLAFPTLSKDQDGMISWQRDHGFVRSLQGLETSQNDTEMKGRIVENGGELTVTHPSPLRD